MSGVCCFESRAPVLIFFAFGLCFEWLLTTERFEFEFSLRTEGISLSRPRIPWNACSVVASRLGIISRVLRRVNKAELDVQTRSRNVVSFKAVLWADTPSVPKTSVVCAFRQLTLRPSLMVVSCHSFQHINILETAHRSFMRMKLSLLSWNSYHLSLH